MYALRDKKKAAGKSKTDVKETERKPKHQESVYVTSERLYNRCGSQTETKENTHTQREKMFETRFVCAKILSPKRIYNKPRKKNSKKKE
jgi:formylmethanofuran dehydrogenase subunit E